MTRHTLKIFPYHIVAIVIVFMVSVSIAQAENPIVFTGLGTLDGGGNSSSGRSISPDGSTVVGSSGSTAGSQAFIWTQEGGIFGLGDLDGGGFSSVASDVSSDGTVIVGSGLSAASDPYGEAFYWTASSGLGGLGDLSGGDFYSVAFGVSWDGSVVVGRGTSNSGSEAFRWTLTGGMTGLGDLPSGSFGSSAGDVSADGLVVVGFANSASGLEAFKWTAMEGMVGLGDLPGGSFSSGARGVSGDGRVIVGFSSSASGGEAFRWTASGGMVGLDDLPGGAFQSTAAAASWDGSVVVGSSHSATDGEAFIWDAVNGMRSLNQVLTNAGVNTEGWVLTNAEAISADGLTIAGKGRCPSGTCAWVVQFPSRALERPVLHIGPALYYPTQSSAESIYQLIGRVSPFTNEWFTIGSLIQGTGNTIYGFERGKGRAWLPSRGWNISESTDGYSLQFDGLDDFAFRGHDPLLNLSSGMTLEAWVNPTASGTEGTVVAKAASPSIVSYRLRVTAAGQGSFQVFDSGGIPFVDLTGGVLLTNALWTHLAAAYDGSTARLFSNGVLDSSMSATGSVRISGLSPLGVGGILGSETFNGLIDEVRIWDHARSEQSVSDNYQTKLAGNEAGLVAYWQLQESGLQTASDTTANAFDLTLGDTPSPGSFDPIWFAESFPGTQTFQQLFEFGTPWFSVFWNTVSNAAYQMEFHDGSIGGAWTTLVAGIQGTGGEVDYFEQPEVNGVGIPETRMYRVLGPPANISTNPPTGMALVPAGTFRMGDVYNMSDPQRPAIPVHEVFISDFFVDRLEVTKELWDEVYTWATNNSYAFAFSGSAPAPDHPVTTIDWFDCLKWCNARSERDGLTPMIYTDSSKSVVYRSGEIIPGNNAIDWDGNGFRLPTEAEWEKAARGGLVDNHYPWPSTGGSYTNHIHGGFANYKNSGDPYDNGTTPAAYYDGKQTPVGPDTANGYGLYDVAGNVWERCWDIFQVDWYSQPGATEPDTKGPSTGSISSRVTRGGAWSGDPGQQSVRCPYRNDDPTGSGLNYLGFRAVRRP